MAIAVLVAGLFLH